MALATNYTKVYQRYVKGRKRMGDPLKNLERGGFYQLVEYDYVDEEDSKTWSASTSPIIYILYVSGKEDLVHCIKVSSINPQTVKRLFTQLIDEKDGELAYKLLNRGRGDEYGNFEILNLTVYE